MCYHTHNDIFSLLKGVINCMLNTIKLLLFGKIRTSSDSLSDLKVMKNRCNAFVGIAVSMIFVTTLICLMLYCIDVVLYFWN